MLLGPPASGKGTQGRWLADSLGLAYLSTGALLREAVEEGTLLGKQAEPILARGEYLPDDLMCPIAANWLSRQHSGWVLDGFPRSLPQATFLDHWLAGYDLQIDAAVSFDAPFENLVARIRDRVECPGCRWSGRRLQLRSMSSCPECGQSAGRRFDDSEDNFRSRHAEFVRLTQPVIGHYQRLDLLCPCDATPPQAEVAARLLQMFLAGAA